MYAYAPCCTFIRTTFPAVMKICTASLCVTRSMFLPFTCKTNSVCLVSDLNMQVHCPHLFYDKPLMYNICLHPLRKINMIWSNSTLKFYFRILDHLFLRESFWTSYPKMFDLSLLIFVQLETKLGFMLYRTWKHEKTYDSTHLTT